MNALPLDIDSPPSARAPGAECGVQDGPAPLRGEAQSGAGPLLQIHVVGTPAPQGSKRGFVVGNRAVIVDDNKPRLRTWRQDVKDAALDAIELMRIAGRWSGPLADCDVDITFLLARPKGHYRTGRNAHLLRDSAPSRPTVKPDVDKLLRSCLDALTDTAIVRDDANVVNLTGRKTYTTGHAGAVIAIYSGERTT